MILVILNKSIDFLNKRISDPRLRLMCLESVMLCIYVIIFGGFVNEIPSKNLISWNFVKFLPFSYNEQVLTVRYNI